MTKQVKPIPENLNSITPSLVSTDAARAIDFYKKALWRHRTGAYVRARRQNHACGIEDWRFQSFS